MGRERIAALTSCVRKEIIRIGGNGRAGSAAIRLHVLSVYPVFQHDRIARLGHQTVQQQRVELVRMTRHEYGEGHKPLDANRPPGSNRSWVSFKPYPGRIVCDIDGSDAEAEVNTRLIAAAPELLSALVALSDSFDIPEVLEHDLDNHEPGECTLCVARAAIAKAGG